MVGSLRQTTGMDYVSQEAAFEVAVSAASGELRKGNEIRIEVVGLAYDRAGDGSMGEPGIVHESQSFGYKLISRERRGCEPVTRRPRIRANGDAPGVN